MTEPLPAYYYLDNFHFLLNWVSNQHEDLLSDDELAFINTFRLLERDSQCLLVRMLGRKGVWFRSSKLRYAEVDDHDRAASQLLEHKLISSTTPLSLNELAEALTKPELILLFNDHLRPHKNQRKEYLLDILAEHYPEQLPWEQWTANQLDRLFYVDVQHIHATLMLLFFGNPYQDLTEFVLQDLGLFKYERYTIDKQHRVFKNRSELEQYQQLLLLRDQLTQANELELLQQLLPKLPEKFDSTTIERRRARLFNQLAYEFERYSELGTALNLYQQVDLPPSRERQIRLLEKSGEIQQAWQLLTNVINAPSNEHELQVAERMAPRLAKKAGIILTKKATQHINEQRISLPHLTNEYGEYLSVEEITRRHIDADETPCFYAENLLLNGLFGLWLWPEMFRGVDGAFANPFQTAPLDLYQENFQHNRPEIRALWQLLDEQQHIHHIKSIWTEKFGIANNFVHWQFLDERILIMALECVPARDLKLIFERLMFDLKTNRSGLPDLIQFFPNSYGQPSYRMIEVKGPGDRIQDNQARWLNFFSTHVIPAEVWYVSWE